jgi:DNA modification methylase
MKKTKLMLGDNIESLKKLPDNSIDSVVTDPPYGLSFMGKKWDHDVPSVDFWKEVYRVLKHGGHVLSFGGTRTYHRMVVNIEDAGFEIRDQIMWLYGSGFPKSHNIGKAVDKLQGNERVEWLDEKKTQPNIRGNGDQLLPSASGVEVKDREPIKHSKGQSDWEGWGTALKPANEPICVARKPLSEKSVAENVLKWGTGGINIDGCRVETNRENERQYDKEAASGSVCGDSNFGKNLVRNDNWLNEGRFPANIILECLCDEVIKGEKGEVKKTTRGKSFGEIAYGELNKDKSVEGIDNYNDKGDIHTNPMCPCYIMDEQSGVSSSQNGKSKTKINNKDANWFRNAGGDIEERWGFGDKGGASRFFYQAKVSKAERNMGLDDFEDKKKIHLSKKSRMKEQGTELDEPATGFERFTTIVKNNHPTVKPVNLMAYLCRLVTPPNGIVLDPYMGSGATGIAAQLEGFRFVGMELDEDYFKIAEARINNYEKYSKFKK